MSSLSSGDLMRQFAQQLIAAQEAKTQAPAQEARQEATTDSTAASLAAAPPQVAQAAMQEAGAQPAQTQVSPGLSYPDGASGQLSPQDLGVPPQHQAPAQPQAPQDPAQAQLQMQQYEMLRQQQSQENLDAGLAQAHAATNSLDAFNLAATGRNIAALGAGVDSQVQGAKDQAAVEAKIRHDQAPLVQEKVTALQHDAELKQQLDDWHTSTLQQVMDRQNQFRDQLLQLSAEHPEDIWGNASTGGKIAGVIGLIGAGFAGQDVNQRVEQIVQSSVAAQTRKADYLNAANNQEMNIANTAEKMFGSRDAAIKAMTANKLGLIADRMDQVALRYADPMAQARLQQASGVLREKQAQVNAETTNAAMKNQYQGLANHTELLKIQSVEVGRRGSQMGMHGGQELVEGQIDGWKGYFTKEQKAAFAPIAGAGHSLIKSIDRAQELAREIQASRSMSPDESKLLNERYEAAVKQAFTAFRTYSASGANIQGLEENTFKSFFPSVYYIRSVGRALPDSMYGGMDEARDSVVQNLKFNGEARGAGTARFDPTFASYAPTVARWEEQDGTRAKVKQKEDMHVKDQQYAANSLREKREKSRQESIKEQLAPDGTD